MSRPRPAAGRTSAPPRSARAAPWTPSRGAPAPAPAARRRRRRTGPSPGPAPGAAASVADRSRLAGAPARRRSRSAGRSAARPAGGSWRTRSSTGAAAIRSTTRSSTCGQIDGPRLRRRPPSRSARRSAAPSCGHVLDRHDDLRARSAWSTGGCTTVTGRPPAEEPGHLLDRPHRRGQPDPLRRPVAAARPAAPAMTARWAPRLVPATACTSSTITVSTPRSDSRAARSAAGTATPAW